MLKKNNEFKRFMDYKKIKYLDNMSYKHIWYKNVQIWIKEYLFEILEDKEYGTIMYYLKNVKKQN